MANCSLKLLLLFITVFAAITDANKTCSKATKCSDGVLLPAWKPIETTTLEYCLRAAVYLLVLLYTFLGVSIVADRFMMAIERITSQEKEVEVAMKTGEVMKIRVRVWNETVSNLTLMALGSSAPEILLSVIEICGKNFSAGSLGPGTIVGSAAFNLFVIIGFCMIVIPNGQIRRVKHLSVFIITATFSVLAYLWLYIILGVSSYGEIEIWESIVTLLLFPLVVILAYMADRKIFAGKFGSRRIGSGKGRKSQSLLSNDEKNAEEFENLRAEYIKTLQVLRKMHPGTPLPILETMALHKVFGKTKKSRAFYRVHATRLMTGGGNVLSERLGKMKENLEEEESAIKIKSLKQQVFHFDPIHYTVMENVAKVTVRIKRTGGFMDCTAKVKFTTLDDTAHAGSDYVALSGELVFKPFQTEASFDVEIIDDDTYEEDEHFWVIMNDLTIINGREDQGYTYELSKNNKATVMILDDDHCGIFFFEAAIVDIMESDGTVKVAVQRSSGARGTVVIPYFTEDGTGKAGSDYTAKSGELVFKNNETIKTIEIPIHDDGQYERSEYFFVKLGEPVLTDKPAMKSLAKSSKSSGADSEGLPKLGEWSEIKVNIHESEEFKSSVNRLVKMANVSMYAGAETWKDQFKSAIFIHPEVDEDGIEQPPSCLAYVMHYLSMFWKLLFACIPPTEYLGGWLCFLVSISCIGIMTAFIGDLASHFGCSIGLLDEVTAITFVAVGTSLPDTFASKVAATQDDSADSSIGNVTGSNAVNVFLGLGVAWTLAAIVNKVRNKPFLVPVGSLGFSVTVFCALAVTAIIILLFRRMKKFGGGELGGPTGIKIASGICFFGFFITYVVLSSLKSYCII